MLKTFAVRKMPVRAGIALGFAVVFVPVTVARAQDAMEPTAVAQSPGQSPPTQAPAKSNAQKAPAQKAAAPAAAAGGGDAVLRQRVEQLEEQIVDMQVVIGTLESLAKAPTASAAAAPSRSTGGAGDPRVDRLESQLQALTAQMQQMSNKPGPQPDRRSDIAPVPGGALPPLASTGQSGSTGSVSSFGSTTATAGEPDAITGVLSGNSPPAKVGEALPPVSAPVSGWGASPSPGASGSGPAAPGPVAALTPAPGTGDPQQTYSSAYGFLLGQNYGAAQAGFEDFLRRHARDALAPDALFWLGEAHYMQKNYKDASDAFDLVTSSYGTSAKAPEAQLRRAASLVQLGRKDDACAALRQLNTKYPNARPVLKTKAEAERQRAGCA